MPPKGHIVRIRFRGLRAITELRKKIRDPKWAERVLARPVGMIVLSHAQRAFDEQRFGGEQWPPRYPNQSDPVVNLAGLISDFDRGATNPRPRRFQRRPAGIDTGILRRSLTPARGMTARGFSVEVGSTVPYAGRVQFGGESRQAITKEIKDRMARWAKRARKRGMKEEVRKIGPLFRKTVLVTNVVPRPFLGFTPDLIREIIAHVEEAVQNLEKPGIKVKKRHGR